MDLPYKAETGAIASLVLPFASVRTGTLHTIEGTTARDLTGNVPQPSTGLLLLGVVLLLILGLPLKSKPHG